MDQFMIDRLIGAVIEKHNPTVVGLDTKLEYIPEYFTNEIKKQNKTSVYDKLFEFNKAIIDHIYDLVPAVKIQAAYYEMYGIDGVKAFYSTLLYAEKKGLITIADVKRNDIGSTAKAYSSAYLGETNTGDKIVNSFPADFITVNPYLGIDGVKPFADDCAEFNKGIFILVKTSNPSSAQIQDIECANGSKIYEMVGDYTAEWGKNLIGKYGYSSLGAVVGATYPKQSEILRNRLKSVFFLVPGYGSQGGTGADVTAAFDANGLGAVVNASRSILCAYMKNKDMNFVDASVNEVIKMKNDINENLIKMDKIYY